MPQLMKEVPYRSCGNFPFIIRSKMTLNRVKDLISLFIFTLPSIVFALVFEAFYVMAVPIREHQFQRCHRFGRNPDYGPLVSHLNFLCNLKSHL